MKQQDNNVRVQLLTCCISDKAKDISDKLFLGIPQDCQQNTMNLMIAMKDALSCYKPNNGEVLATGTLTLTAGNGNTITVFVNSVQICLPVTFITDLTTTATAIATAINAYTSNPDYTATSSGQVVTISAVEESGDSPNTFVVSYTTTSGGGLTSMTATVTAMTGGVDADVTKNCLTQTEVDSMWDYISSKCHICFAPYNTTYT